MAGKRISLARLGMHYLRFNLSANMSYATSFLIQVFGMVLNNGAFVIFWVILFEQIGGDIAGYEFNDVMFLWSLAATGFGLSVVVFGNGTAISRIIYNGDLDVYLLQPKPVLPNLLMSRMIVSGWGDIAYGVALFFITQPVTWSGVLLFIAFSLLMTGVLTSLRVIYHSMTFFFGNAEAFAGLASELVLSFMLYPGGIFQGPAGWLLHSLIPAALVAYIPASLFASFDLTTFLILLAADGAIVGIALLMFRRGLKRYESGNLIGTRM
ncbi:MAG: ABC-2 family transporter protein [Spirochaetales bacterium]